MELRRPPVVLLDDMLAPAEVPASLLFSAPHAILRADTPGSVGACLEAAAAALAAGRHLAGWIAYEAAAAFEPRIAAAIRHWPEEPLIWLGVFDPPQRLARADVAEAIADAMGGTARVGRLAIDGFGEDRVSYRRKMARIAALIEAGDLYQLNYTFAVDGRFEGDPLALYARLRSAQPVAFGAYIDTGARHVLSLSPELFIESRAGRLTTRPMKGTAPRGRDAEEDAARAADLARDEKSRAENMMIVDLLRNDLSRVAAPGSVEVPELFAVERYPTLLQMTSTIRARRREDVTLPDLLGALFPCGSVTGAPKIRAMERIAALEEAPRGIYTGAIGWLAPDGDLSLSVAIRTLVIEHDGRARFGVGGGIVADSEAEAEYAECRLKAQFLDSAAASGDGDFALIETLAWHPEGGYRHREPHLRRLANSAAHFGFRCEMEAVRAALDEAADSFSAPMLVRLLLASAGALSVSARRLEPWPQPVRLAVAGTTVDSGAPLRRHKTTRRHWCAAPLAAVQATGLADEVIFLNERGEVVEGARTNIFVERAGRLVTPPLSSGPLPGILRQTLLEAGQAVEGVLTLADLAAAPRLHVGNSARGLMPARLSLARP